MSYCLSEDGFHRLHQARDTIRLLKHSNQQAGMNETLSCDLLASFLTLMDEQLSSVVNEASHQMISDPLPTA